MKFRFKGISGFFLFGMLLTNVHAFAQEEIPIPDPSLEPPTIQETPQSEEAPSASSIRYIEQEKGYGIRFSGLFSANGNLPPALGNGDHTSQNLQEGTGGESRLSLTYLRGQGRGLLLGVSYVQSGMSYTQFPVGSRPPGNYQSTQYAYLFDVGAWVALTNGMGLIQGSFSIGPGQMAFSNSSGAGSVSVPILYFEPTVDYIFPIGLGLSSTKIDLIIGAGINTLAPQTFYLNGFQYSLPDFQPGFHYEAGVGIRY